MPRLRMKMEKGFTVINNTILRNNRIGSSPRGLYVTMLSMADGWNFTVRGLASIMGEGVTKISTAMHVLEDEHYLKRVRVYEKGKIVDWDYYLYDEPYPFDDQDENVESSESSDSSGTEDTHSTVFLPSQDTDKQDTDNLDTENQYQVNQYFEKPYIYKETKQEKSKKELSCFVEKSIDQSQTASDDSVENFDSENDDRLIDGLMKDRKKAENQVKVNISYDEFCNWANLFSNGRITVSEINNIVRMIVDGICSKSPFQDICGEIKSRREIAEVMLRVDLECIERAISKTEVRSDITNRKSYFFSVLYKEAEDKDFIRNDESRAIDYDVKHNL